MLKTKCLGFLLLLSLLMPSMGLCVDRGPYTLVSSVSTGAGTAVDLGITLSQSTCHVTWGGTTPTNTVVALEGSIDNSTFAALATVTITATGTMWHVANKPVRYIRGNYVSKSGGDATTAVTMTCTFGGN